MNVFTFAAKMIAVVGTKSSTYTNAGNSIKTAAAAAVTTKTYTDFGAKVSSKIQPTLTRWSVEIDAAKMIAKAEKVNPELVAVRIASAQAEKAVKAAKKIEAALAAKSAHFEAVVALCHKSMPSMTDAAIRALLIG